MYTKANFRLKAGSNKTKKSREKVNQKPKTDTHEYHIMQNTTTTTTITIKHLGRYVYMCVCSHGYIFQMIEIIKIKRKYLEPEPDN